MQSIKQNILFVDKLLVSRQIKPLAGVELFNAFLLKELAEAGYKITLPTTAGWQKNLHPILGALPIEFLPISSFRMDWLSGFNIAYRLRARRFDLLLLGNVGNRLIPLIILLRRMRAADRIALIAHREPRPGFVAALSASNPRVTAVNHQIAGHFERAGILTRVQYGVINSQMFHPPVNQSRSGQVNFCVVGRLERVWKGHADAVTAFKKMSPEIKRKCRLHLAGFAQPPRFDDPDIIAYAWQPLDNMGKFLRQMDVMIVPSREHLVMKETFSQVAVQGMLTSLPLIVSNLPVLTEKIDSGGGLVFHDIDELAATMQRLAGDQETRMTMGACGRETALARYIWNTRSYMTTLS